MQENKEFERFSLTFRIQHLILLISVTTLIITGLPLRFPNSFLTNFIFEEIFSVNTFRIIHRIGGSLLIFYFLFHTFYIIFTKEGRENLCYFLPRKKDILDLIQNIFYFLGIKKDKPKFDRFSYIEKFDYWTCYFGSIIMTTSGLILWFYNKSMQFLPKYILDIIYELHSDEAFLTTLVIVIWHFYNVHLNPDKFPMSKVWITGKIKLKELKKFHPLEYERILKKGNHGDKPN
jgi:cytochrome b subunit of formate dehydrogenase